MQGRDPTPVLPRAATGAAASADQAARTELPAQAQQQEQQHSDGKRWRILVVVVGLGLGAMTDGPKQRVRELCLHHFAQGGSFCSMDEDSRANAALSFAACFFLADCIWCALVATPLYLRGGKDTLIGGVGELRRCWRRRRRRQAREKEKQTRQKGREAALEADRRVKRLKELELAVTSGAMRSKKPVRRRKGLQIQTQKQSQPIPPKEPEVLQDARQAEKQSGLADVAAAEGYVCEADACSDLSAEGTDAGSDYSKLSTDSCGSESSRGSDDVQTQVVVEGVSHKLVVLLLVIIGIIGVAMVLETLQLAKQNREWSGTVDRAVGTDLVINVAKAMHETQKERGMTAIHIGSGGTELLFELGQQHVASDAAIKGMIDALSRHISEHATHLHTMESAGHTADVGVDATRSSSAQGSADDGTFEPSSLMREPSGFDNAVRAVLAFVAELPKRRQRHIPRSDFANLLLNNASLPAVEPKAAASAAESGCGENSNCSSSSSAKELDSMITFYTSMHQSLITVATEMCTDFMTGVAPGVSNQLAPALFAFINLMVLKEKAGIERAVVSGQIALHDYATAANVRVVADLAEEGETGAAQTEAQAQMHLRRDDAEVLLNPQARIPLATMVRLREIVAQQEGYRTAFFRFAPKWAAEAYRSHRKESCVVESLRMRAVLLRPLRKLLGISIVEEDTEWSEVAHGVTKDDYSTEETRNDAGPFTAVDWFSNQTCRLDSLDVLSRKLSWAIEADAKSSRHDAEYRLVWLVTPLGVSFVLTLVVALHAMRTLCAFQDAAQERLASLMERQTLYKTLAERWAPLSLAAGAGSEKACAAICEDRNSCHGDE